MEWIILGFLSLAAPLGVAQAQYALPPGPQPYIDPWGRAHYVWHDIYGFPHISEPMPPPLLPPPLMPQPLPLPPHASLPPPPLPPNLSRSACYDENWHFTGEDNPACEGPMLTK